jgi:hypothetical protein
MEKEALILRARAELAKLQAEYATDGGERHSLYERARAYDAQAEELENQLNGREHHIYRPSRRQRLPLAR